LDHPSAFEAKLITAAGGLLNLAGHLEAAPELCWNQGRFPRFIVNIIAIIIATVIMIVIVINDNDNNSDDNNNNILMIQW
jgi:hypothetical protein